MKTHSAATKIEARETMWGFYGTFKHNFQLSDADMVEVFDRAARFTAKHLKISSDAARRFLDSTLGRHLADAFSAGDTVEQKLEVLYTRWRKDVREFRQTAINTTDEDFYR